MLIYTYIIYNIIYCIILTTDPTGALELGVLEHKEQLNNGTFETNGTLGTGTIGTNGTRTGTY